MIVDRASVLFTPEQIKKIEEKYKATYVCETCVRAKSGEWANQPVAVFYTEEPHPQGLNWFGLFFRWKPGGAADDLILSITDAKSATLEPFQGLSYDGKTVYYSRYRHDFRTVPGGFVDGGRDYLRYQPPAMIVKLQIIKDKLVILDEENPTIDTPANIS